MNGILTTSFGVKMDPYEVYRGRMVMAVRDLRTRLQAEYERRFPGEVGRVRDAMAEAEVAAWHMEFPHLFLPDLAEEAVARVAVSSKSEQRYGITSFSGMA